MPNATGGFFSRFRKPANVNNANKNLERNVGIYVQSYLKNRNVPNKVPPINNYMARALHKYINAKRVRAGANAAAAVKSAGGSNETAARAAQSAVQTSLSSTPATAGNNVRQALLAIQAPPVQQVAGAAAAANQQALALRQTPAAAQQAGAKAAAAATQQARPNATPAQQAQTAAAGAAAAGLPTTTVNNAAKVAAINALKAQTEAVRAKLNKPNERVNLLKTLTNLNTNAKVNAAIKAVRGQNPNANWANTKANGLTNGQKKVLNGLKMGKNYVGLVRQKTPNVNVNLGNTGLFKQAQTQAPKTNNRNVNAIRAKLAGPNMTPGEWYRYAASLGYNTGKYANEANRLMTAGNKKALSTFIIKSMMAVHPNKGNRTNAKNQQIRNLLTRNLTKARSNLAEN